VSRRIRKTKLIATIGPACESEDTLAAMIAAGMNVARFNFSHGSHEEHRKRLDRLRAIAEAQGANVATMLDTKGIEIRTRRVEGGAVVLAAGDPFTLHTDDRLGDTRGVSVSYEGLPQEAKRGSSVLLDDGAIELRVERVTDEALECRVVRGGRLYDRRGVNLPGTSLAVPSMSPENRADLHFAIEHDLTYIAASFVRRADDVREIRQVLTERGAEIPIIAKIESAEGVERLEEIVAEADGIMVARGDLGVELPVREVPIVQKKIIRTTVMNGKPVITATQMLDSMKSSRTPTRAEVSDVANAIFDGTSAVMLSNETAAGDYPVEAVETMDSLALEAEAALDDYGHLQQIRAERSNQVTEAISQAAITMAHHLKAAAVLALTESGFTARSISKYRPRCPILGVTPWPAVARRFALNWGVTGILIPAGSEDNDEMIQSGLDRARQAGYVQAGDLVVVTAGVSQKTGSTNLIRVVEI
jgi:pyruvate kinase